MDEIAHLPGEVWSDLLRALEAASTIRSRSDLFLWAQGPLQAILPHDLFIGLLLDENRRVQHFEGLYSVVLKPGTMESLMEKDSGLLVRTSDICGDSPQGYWELPSSANSTHSEYQGGLLADLNNLGFSGGVFQSSGLLGDRSSSFFAFLGAVRPLQYTHLLLQVILPQLHLALSRCFSGGVRQEKLRDDGVSNEANLSARQLEVLGWVKLGKTNFEISVIIGISELTVKNHLQNLFKKLNVHNRAQAVAKVFSRS